jgi:hypothetical protein
LSLSLVAGVFYSSPAIVCLALYVLSVALSSSPAVVALSCFSPLSLTAYIPIDVPTSFLSALDALDTYIISSEYCLVWCSRLRHEVAFV